MNTPMAVRIPTTHFFSLKIIVSIRLFLLRNDAGLSAYVSPLFRIWCVRYAMHTTACVSRCLKYDNLFVDNYV